MSCSLLVLALLAGSTGQSIPAAEVKKQETVFEQWWYDGFVWKFEDLPSSGGVSKTRVPYSGFIYLDKDGGTADVLYKYDRALNANSRGSAAAWERSNSAAAYERSRGLFRKAVVHDWYGHCNGWAAAAIRHAEPQNNVSVNGVTFTPADIKGLLAEIYVYNQHELLAGFKSHLNPGSLHAIFANWLGRGSHPIVMDSDPGEEKWNYPIYSFSSASRRRSGNQVEVSTNVLYAKDSEDREHNVSPEIHEVKSFHYMLQLNDDGEITGGYYFSDSDRIDFVWVPLSAIASGEAGNEGGNPHLDVAEVLSIWRKSVPRATRRQWLIIDPAKKDRAVEVPDPTVVLPRNITIVPLSEPAGEVANAESTETLETTSR